MNVSVFTKNSTRHYLPACFILPALSLLLFWPVLNKPFASDDFLVLHRIIYYRTFFIRDFFRPLSDISLYGSYLVAGIHPLFYNITNVIIHAGCAFLLYLVCFAFNFPGIKNKSFFAWFAAVLFLIYPFHNEAVIWAIGRGIVLSGFFGFLSLLVVFPGKDSRRKYLLSCVFYFIGLCGYETIIPLPAIILILLYTEGESLKNLMKAGTAYGLTLAVNLAVRLLVAGNLWGSYASKTFSSSPAEYCIKFFKAAGRLFLPPSTSVLFLTIGFIILMACIAGACIFVLKKRSGQIPFL